MANTIKTDQTPKYGRVRKYIKDNTVGTMVTSVTGTNSIIVPPPTSKATRNTQHSRQGVDASQRPILGYQGTLVLTREVLGVTTEPFTARTRWLYVMPRAKPLIRALEPENVMP